MGWETYHLSGPKQIDCTVMEEDADGLHFYRTPKPAGLLAHLPGGDPFAVMGAIEKRLLALAKELQPDVIHAHSPVLDAVLTLAKRLDMMTVAEGVETPEQAKWLHERGVRFLQGYWISRPLLLDEFVDWVSQPHALKW
ncbi:hypothetical protein SDC9_202504 [bioreactor metagenome]|uniref:EAL domain-containing protein n=1 Tax=bioreactor metagenome TaxID=1076179 RepID=A0A645IUK4_9ZZZZ